MFPVARTDERPPSFGVLGMPKISFAVELPIALCLPCAGALATRPPALFAALLIVVRIAELARSSFVPFDAVLAVVPVVTRCLVGTLGDPLATLWLFTLFRALLPFFALLSVHIFGRLLPVSAARLLLVVVPFERWLFARRRWVGVQFMYTLFADELLMFL